MSVFESRLRRACAQKRTPREMVIATLLLMALMASCSIAGWQAVEVQKIERGK